MLRRFIKLSLSLIMEHKNCKRTVVTFTKFAMMYLILTKKIRKCLIV